MRTWPNLLFSVFKVTVKTESSKVSINLYTTCIQFYNPELSTKGEVIKICPIKFNLKKCKKYQTL